MVFYGKFRVKSLEKKKKILFYNDAWQKDKLSEEYQFLKSADKEFFEELFSKHDEIIIESQKKYEKL